MTFQASSVGPTVECTNFIIIEDGVTGEGSETFIAVLEPLSSVKTSSPAVAVITIVDSDGEESFTYNIHKSK